MHDTRILPAAACQFALACNLTTAYYMLTMADGMPGWFYPQVMLLYAPLVFLLNRLFLRRERSLLALGGVNIALCGCMVGAYLLLERWQGIAYFAFVAIFLAWLTFRGCRTAMQGASLRGTLLTLDAAFVLLVAFVCYSSATALAPLWSIPAVGGLCATIISAVILRSSHSPGVKGWLAVAGAFALLFALLWVVTGAAAPAGQGLVAVWSLIAAGFNAVKGMVLRFFLFLLSLLPDAEPGEMDWLEQGEAIIIEDTPQQEGSPVFGIVVFVLFAVVLAVGLVWLLRQLSRIRLRSVGKVQTTALPRRERMNLLPALLRLLRSWYAGVKLRLLLWQGQNTPDGLYFLLVHRCRRAPWHKRPGETPRQFLDRLCEAAGGDEALSRALTDLARETDIALYSGRPGKKKLAYAPLIRRRIGRALGRQFLRRLTRKLPFAAGKA